MSSLADLRVGTVVDGFVANRNQYGVFVDIGVGKDAKLKVPKSIANQFYKGDQVSGMAVESVDLEQKLITVSMEQPQAQGAGAAPRNQALATRPASGRGKGAGKGATWGPSSGRGLPARFRVGATVNGVVQNVTAKGVRIDINAPKYALLELPKQLARQFQTGDEVIGMVVEANDGAEILVSLDSPELQKGGGRGRGAQSRSPPRQEAQAKRQPRAKSRPGRQPTQGAKDWAHPQGMSIEDVEVGREFTGIVTNSANETVFLDIGAVKDGKLRMDRKQAKKFKPGDEVPGLIVDKVDVEAGNIQLMLSYELADEPEYVYSGSRSPPQSRSPPRSNSKAKAGAR